ALPSALRDRHAGCQRALAFSGRGAAAVAAGFERATTGACSAAARRILATVWLRGFCLRRPALQLRRRGPKRASGSCSSTAEAANWRIFRAQVQRHRQHGGVFCFSRKEIYAAVSAGGREEG